MMPTPWHGQTVIVRKAPPAGPRARKQMTELELESGITPEEYEAFHAAQRARVRARINAERYERDYEQDTGQ